MEFRTEESVDVRSYVFQRNLTTVVVPLGNKLQQIKDDYLQVSKEMLLKSKNFEILKFIYRFWIFIQEHYLNTKLYKGIVEV